MMDKITTPRTLKLGSAGTLAWDPAFGAGRTRRFAAAQSYVDAQVLRRSEPYVPYGTGRLAASGTAAGGEVSWRAPYAAAQYYSAAGTNGKRGPYWFERMKIDHRGAILRGAAALTGGTAK